MYRFRSIDYIKGKIKAGAALTDKREVFYALSALLLGLCGFFLGRIYAIEEKRPPVTIRQVQTAPISPVLKRK